MPNKKEWWWLYLDDGTVNDDEGDCVESKVVPESRIRDLLAEAIRRRNEELVKEIEGMILGYPCSEKGCGCFACEAIFARNSAIKDVLKLIKK